MPKSLGSTEHNVSESDALKVRNAYKAWRSMVSFSQPPTAEQTSFEFVAAAPHLLLMAGFDHVHVSLQQIGFRNLLVFVQARGRL